MNCTNPFPPMTIFHDPTDPLARAIAPPANETPEERLARKEKEDRAVEISRLIDVKIKAEEVAMKKKKKPVKVLVLGQSLSGAQP